MKRVANFQLPRQIQLSPETWATRYNGNWVVWHHTDGVIGIALTETEVRQRFG